MRRALVFLLPLCWACGPGSFVNDPTYHPDFNGDGFADVLHYQLGLGEQGRLERADRDIFFGGPDAFSRTLEDNTPCEADFGCRRFAPVFDRQYFGDEIHDKAIYFLIGDVNGDGRSDVLGYNSFGVGDGTSGVFHGDAEIGLPDVADYRLSGLGQGVTQQPIVTALGDVNCDGFDDFLYVFVLPIIYLGGEAGVSDDRTLRPTGPGEPTKTGALGDIDGDGCEDMIVAQEIFLGAPGGPEGTGLVMTEADFGPYRPRLPADVNGDGLMDMQNLDFTNGTGITRFGDADGVFPTSNFPFGFLSAVGDVDGDGDDDSVFFTSEANTRRAFISSGDPNAAAVTDDFDDGKETEFKIPDIDRIGSGVGSVGDIDGDGRSEFGIAVPAEGNSVRVLIYRGSAGAPQLVFDIFGDVLPVTRH